MNLGVIGYGYWGPNLVRNFTELGGCSVAAVADLDAEKAALVKRRHPNIRATTEVESVLADPVIDAVVIATPVRTHFPLAMQALRHGKGRERVLVILALPAVDRSGIETSPVEQDLSLHDQGVGLVGRLGLSRRTGLLRRGFAPSVWLLPCGARVAVLIASAVRAGA